MDDVTELRQRERQAYTAYSRLRDALDTLPEDHPATPPMVDVVALAEVHWRKLRDDLAAVEQGQRQTTHPDPQ